MPKIKTVKTLSKRVKVTKNKKFLTIQPGQNHFRSRHSGSAKMGRRRYRNSPATETKSLKQLLPHS